MSFESGTILPLTIWGQSQIKHRISTIAVSPDFKYFVTGSWDGNIFIWKSANAIQGSSLISALTPSWMITGQTTAVSAIACFNELFVTCHLDGSTCHYELPNGYHRKRIVDHCYIHTSATTLGENQVMCSGFYPDIVILDAYSLEITVFLQSREQADWVSCFRSFPKDNGIQVQGITTSGFLKTWALNDIEDGICLESSLGPLGVRHSKAMAFHMTRRWLLLVTTSQVLVFDVGIHVIFKYTSKEALEGGDFFNDKVVFWTKHGKVYECDVKGKATKKILELNCVELHVPGNRLLVIGDERFFVAADIKGTLAIWRLEISDSITPLLRTSSDASHVTNPRSGLVDHLGLSIICSIHISHLNKFVAGCHDGRILVFPATDLILAYFSSTSIPDFVCLSSHRGAVRCILYPHAEEPSYHESLLLSGGDDFSVCLWDIFKRELLHRFCVHSGPVVRLLTPPGENPSRLANSICSVSQDHSVAMLSLRDRRCAFLASQHPFPIVAVRWKPCHDFLIVKCFDGSVFVWELKTGVLDRVVCGIAAEEVVYGCDQGNEDVLWDFYTAGPTSDELPRQPLHVSLPQKLGPVLLCGMLVNPYSEAFVLLLDIGKLCMHLKTIFPGAEVERDAFRRIHALAKAPDTVGLPKTIFNVLDAIKLEAEHLHEKFLPSASRASPGKIIERKVSAVSGTQLIPYAQLALSLLHVWGKNKQDDEICIDKLGLFKPLQVRSFDFASDLGSLSLRHPSSDDVERTKWDFASMASLVNVLDRFSFSMTCSDIESSEWQKMVQSLDVSFDIPSCEKLASLWHTKSIVVRKIVRKILPDQLLKLSRENSLQLLEKWHTFLPTVRPDEDHLSATAIVMCSLLTVDCKCSDDSESTKEVGVSLRKLVTTPDTRDYLLAAAVDLLGRGFPIWEQFFPVDEALVAIFERCSEHPDPDLILTSRTAIAAIARDRLSQCLAHLKFMCKTGHPTLENSKAEIISLLRELLVELPRGLVAILSDAIEVLLACIDPAHLREAELSALLGVWLPQLHHNLAGQRVAVGMGDGKIVIHDLRARRVNIFTAHNAPITAVRFSPDGKCLLALCDSGTASLWQLSHGLFDMGVGQFRFKNVKMFPTGLTDLNVIKAVNISWVDSKSIKIETQRDVDLPSNIVSFSI